MNARIKQLVEQATRIGVKTDKFGGTEYTSVFDKEKFAELIVKECTKVCAPIPGLPFSAEIEAARYGCAKDIKQHFGIEE